MKNYFLLLVWCSAVQASGLLNSLTEYHGHKSYQAGDFKTAEVEYAKLLSDNPYDVQNNYNVGTAQYKQKKFDDAHQSFNRAVLHATPHSLMHEQALFNRANCLVQKNKLQDAVKDYKKVLQINPDNVPAKTNLQIVEKMLKEPPKKDQQQSKDKNKQKNNEQQQDKNQESKNHNDQSDKNQSEKQQNDQADKQKNGNNSQNEQKQRDEQEEHKEQDETKDQQAEKLQKTKDEKSRANKEQTSKEQQEAQHKQSLSQADKNQSTNADHDGQNSDEQKVELYDALAQQMMEKPKDDKRLEKRSAVLLDKLDEYEKNIQKKLLQMNVTKQGAQKHGQKNW